MLNEILNKIENLKFDSMFLDIENDKIKMPKNIQNREYLSFDGKCLEIKNSPMLVDKFPKIIKENGNWIADIAEYIRYDTKSSTIKQIKWAILYMEHMKKNSNTVNQMNDRESDTYIVSGQNCSATIMLILSIYYAILKGYGIIQGIFEREHIGHAIFSLFDMKSCAKETVHQPLALRNYSPDYTTQIIFDTADIGSALDELANTFDNMESLWRIRNVWIQESLRDKFLQQIPSKLQKHIVRDDQRYGNDLQKTIEKAKKFGATDIIQRDGKYSTLIIGVNRQAIMDNDDSNEELDVETNNNIIFINWFRTPKELQTLLKNSVANQSVSMWSENISIIYEMINNLNASIIWCNCIGILNPSIPFVFNSNNVGMPWFSRNNETSIPGVLVDGKYSFQRWKNVNSETEYKTVVVAFGSTFAN